MARSLLRQHIDTLPDLAGAMIGPLQAASVDTFSKKFAGQIERIYLLGCGDSHHATVATTLAFSQLTGLPCQAMTAMQFSRFTAGYLPAAGQGANLVIAVSVSGEVSRTIEALRLARQAAAATVAVTGNKNSPLAQIAAKTLHVAIPPLEDELAGAIVPGTRSFIASLLALYQAAIQIGITRRYSSSAAADKLQERLAKIPGMMEQLIHTSAPLALQIARAWSDANYFVFCGAGPGYGTALFSAAKILEASGDPAVGQDLEEWAHLEYFGREAATPTFIISSGRRDEDRALEILTAARTIGRRVALIAPEKSTLANFGSDVYFPVPGPIQDAFSPLLNSIPGMLFADQRSQIIKEPYFRAFSGGRSQEGGGGISRIKTSKQIDQLSS